MQTWILLTSILEAVLIACSIYLFFSRRNMQRQLAGQIHAAASTESRLTLLEDVQRQEAQTFKQTEDKLRSYLQLMDTLVNTIPNPLFYKDIDGVYLGCNQVFASDILGLSRDRIIGFGNPDLADRIPAHLARSLADCDRRLRSTQEVQSFESQVPCADGRQRDFLFYIAPVGREEGQTGGSIGLMLDLTEKNLATHNRMQKEKFQGVLETAGAVCHELNQPLQVLSGYVDLVLMDTPQGTLPRDLAHQIQEQVDRMADITRKLQQITRYETMMYGDHFKIIDIHKASRPEKG